MSVNGNITCGNLLWNTSLSAANTTVAKMLVDQALGGLPLPDNAFSPNMPQYTRGGQRIVGGSITSTDTAKDILLYRASVLTQQDSTITGALAVATTSTITRVTGDFRMDGWSIGDTLMVFGAAPTVFSGKGAPAYSLTGTTTALLASTGIACIITALTATTITVSGTPLVVESLSGCRLIRTTQSLRQTITAAAGNASATPAVLLIGGTNDVDVASLPPEWRGISLGAKDVLLIAAQATLSALPAQIHANALCVAF